MFKIQPASWLHHAVIWCLAQCSPHSCPGLTLEWWWGASCCLFTPWDSPVPASQMFYLWSRCLCIWSPRHSCHFSKGRHLHESLNDAVWKSLESAKIPCHLDPSGLSRSDGKRPDGAILCLGPWKVVKILVWGVTCHDTIAPSYASLAVHEPGAVAVEAE